MTAPCGAPAMARSNVHGLGFTLFLAALTALPPLSIDMALPSLGLIQADLHAPQTKAAASIAIFIAGFSTAPIVVGPLADRFGRKAVMLVGLVLFTLTAAGSALAPSIDALLAFRLVQGSSAGAVGILPRAIIRDLFEGREARLHLAAVSLVFSVAPLIAPTLGAGILFGGSWRLIFAVLTCVGAIVMAAALVLFDESHAAENRRNLKPSTIIAGYRRALTNPACAGFSLLGGLLFAGLFAAPLHAGVRRFQNRICGPVRHHRVGRDRRLDDQRLAPQPPRQAEIGDGRRARGRMFAALALLAVGLAGLGSALIVAALVMVYISAFGLIYPNAAHEAVHPLPEIAGLASAVLVTAQMLFGAPGGVAAAALYRDASPVELGAIMSAAALAAAALYAFWLWGKVGA